MALADGDLRSDRVWLSEGFVLNGVHIDFINFCLKQGVVTQPYVFVYLQKPHHKPNFYQFANVQHIEIRNSLSIPF